MSGTVKAGAVAVIYNSELVKQPTVSISQNGGQFRGSLTLTLTARNTTEATYKIGNNAPVKFISGDTITIGADMAENTSVDITLFGKNDDGETSKTYTFTKISTPVLDGKTVVYFDNSTYKWDNVNLYAYYRNSNNNVVNNAEWPGVKMTDLGGDIYGYILDDSWDYSTAYVIFNNGNGTQFPSDVGYEVKKGDHKIFNGSGLEDYVTEVPTTPTTPTTPPETTNPVDRLHGDADADGKIGIDDVTCIQKYVAELQIDHIDSELSDVNFDGDIDIQDATMIQKHLAGIIELN